jgi:hypothetical protein
MNQTHKKPKSPQEAEDHRRSVVEEGEKNATEGGQRRVLFIASSAWAKPHVLGLG